MYITKHNDPVCKLSDTQKNLFLSFRSIVKCDFYVNCASVRHSVCLSAWNKSAVT